MHNKGGKVGVGKTIAYDKFWKSLRSTKLSFSMKYRHTLILQNSDSVDSMRYNSYKRQDTHFPSFREASDQTNK